jgi:outer membrane protein assembly factor BamB
LVIGLQKWVRWGLGVVMLTAVLIGSAGSAGAAEVTGAADSLRTGWYPDEPLLAPALVTKERFTQLFNTPLKGQIYAQPLLANGVLLVASEENWVYGLDPVTGQVRWEHQFGTPVSSSELPKECADLTPRIGITATPVIDAERNIAYFVANEVKGKEASWKMHAINLASGEENAPFPVLIHGPAQNPGAKLEFEPLQELQRPALLMTNGVVYAGFGSHCDNPPFEGWLAGVSTAGELTTMWATSEHGDSIWQSGGGLVSDRSGQIIFSTGNGESTDPPPGPGNKPPEGLLGESVVRVAAQPNGEVAPIDFFSPFNNGELDGPDIDLGSSAPVGLPSQYFGTRNVQNLLVQDGKFGMVYLLNRDDLGGMGQAAGKDKVVQELGPFGGVWGAAAVWPGDGRWLSIPTVGEPASANDTVNSLNFFRYEEDGSGNPHLSAPITTAEEFFFGSGSPIVTSDGTTNGSGVLWIVRCAEHACQGTEGELRAYTAKPNGPKPTPFWSANIGAGTKFSRPLASGGHIYVANHEGHIIAFSGPILTPSPESLGFAATVGETKSQELTFTSTGTPLEVKEVRSPTGSFSASGLPAPGAHIEPGQARKVSVSFKPTAAGPASGEVAILTKQGTETKVTLSGTAEATARENTELQQKERERTEREARERAEREARERSEAAGRGTTVPVSLVTSPAGTAPLSAEPLPRLTKLKIRASASKLASHRRKLAIGYTLSVPATVTVVIYHRVISHHCPGAAAACGRWVATKLKVNVSAHVGSNTLSMDLGTLSAGTYRLGATPLTRSGARGLTRYLEFKTLHQ